MNWGVQFFKTDQMFGVKLFLTPTLYETQNFLNNSNWSTNVKRNPLQLYETQQCLSDQAITRTKHSYTIQKT